MFSRFFKPATDEWDLLPRYTISGICASDEHNEKNCIEYTPFCDTGVDGCIYVKKEWFGRYADLFKNASVILVSSFPDKHPVRQSPLFKSIVRSYFELYDYRRDMMLMNRDVMFVTVPVKVLQTVYNKEDWFDSEWEYTDWYMALSQAIAHYNNYCFVRGEKQSAKHSSGKCVVHTPRECLATIGKSTDIVASLAMARSTYIAVMPWNDDIRLSNEFRLFVLDGKLKAISQQKWFVYAGITRSYIDSVVPSLIKYSEVLIEKLGYTDACFDVWVGDEVHLIETNPGGRWACSSSLLFRWTDEDVWRDDGSVSVRYVESFDEDELD